MDIFWTIVFALFVGAMLLIIVVPVVGNIERHRYACPHAHIRSMTPLEVSVVVRSRSNRRLVCEDCGAFLDGPMDLIGDGLYKRNT